MFRARGGADFRKVLAALEKMGEVWTSARINAHLGQAVMRKLDQHLANLRRAANPSFAANSRNRSLLGFSNGESGHSANVTSGVVASAMNSTTEPGPKPFTAQTSSLATDAKDAEPTLHNNKQPLGFSPQDSRLSEKAPCVPDQHLTDADASLAATWNLQSAANENPVPSSLAWAFHQSNGTDKSQPGKHANTFPSTVDQAPRVFSETLGPVLRNSALEASSMTEDDTLFHSWDPMFAQSIDFSFSSILDLGNPFAWPEYCMSPG